MKNIFKKLSVGLVLMASALFIQVKAEDYQKTLNNLQIIKTKVEAIKPYETDAYTTRRHFHKIESVLKQLPDKMQEGLKPKVAAFKGYTAQDEKDDLILGLNEWQTSVQVALSDERNREKLAQEEAQQTMWGRFTSGASKGASQLYGAAQYYGGRAASGAKWVAETALSPITWPVGKLMNATNKQKIAAAEELEIIESKLEKIIKKEAGVKGDDQFEYLVKLSNERNELNKKAAPYLIMLEEKYNWKKVAVYTGIATATIVGCIAATMTEQQRKAILKDPIGAAKNAPSFVVNSYNSFKMPTLAEIQNYIKQTGESVRGRVASRFERAKGYASELRDKAYNYWRYGKAVSQKEAAGAVGEALGSLGKEQAAGYVGKAFENLLKPAEIYQEGLNLYGNRNEAISYTLGKISAEAKEKWDWLQSELVRRNHKARLNAEEIFIEGDILRRDMKAYELIDKINRWYTNEQWL